MAVPVVLQAAEEAARAGGVVGKEHMRSAILQLAHVGRPSSQRIWRRLHSTQPLRDLRWWRLALVGAGAPGAAAAAAAAAAAGWARGSSKGAIMGTAM